MPITPATDLPRKRGGFQDRLSAADVNKLSDAIAALRNVSGAGFASSNMLGVRSAATPLSGANGAAYGQVAVFNDSAEILYAHSPAVIVGLCYENQSGTDAQRVASGMQVIGLRVRGPEEGDDLGNFVILQDEIPAKTSTQMWSAMAWCGCGTLVWAPVGRASGAEETWCDIDPAQAHPPHALWAQTDGLSRIIWHEGTLGATIRWALVALNVRSSAGGGTTGTELITARLTSTTSPFSWVEAEWDGETLIDKPSGSTGTTNLYEINGRSRMYSSESPAGLYVQIWRIPDGDGYTDEQYAFDVGTGNYSNIMQLAPADGSSVTSEDAYDDYWDVAEHGDYAVEFIPYRECYSESGDKIKYGFYRTLRHDSNGKLINVSAETRYTVFEPEVCEA